MLVCNLSHQRVKLALRFGCAGDLGVCSESVPPPRRNAPRHPPLKAGSRDVVTVVAEVALDMGRLLGGLRTGVVAVPQLAAIAARQSFVITEGAIDGGELAQLVALASVLVLGRGDDSFNEAVD